MCRMSTLRSLLSCFSHIIPTVPFIDGYIQGCINAVPTCFYYLRGIIRLDPQQFLRLLARVLSRKGRDVFLLVSPISWAGNYLVSSTYLIRGKMLCQFCFGSQFSLRTSPRTPCPHLIPDNLEKNIHSWFCYVMDITVFICLLSSQHHIFAAVFYILNA